MSEPEKKISSLAAAIVAVLALAASFAALPVEAAPEDSYPRLTLLTDLGELELELYTDAAPAATSRLLELAGEQLELRLENVRPYSLVISSELSALGGLEIENDAAALGLEADRIADLGQAMNVLQDEILPIHVGNKTSPPTAAFQRWMQVWRAQRQPDFLLGLSRRQLLEGFGCSFQDGLASRPVRSGSVLLRPAGDGTAEPKLVFALGDWPRKTGRWMVLGRVTRGLEQLRDLSASPLADPFAKSGQLLRPVEVESIALGKASFNSSFEGSEVNQEIISEAHSQTSIRTGEHSPTRPMQTRSTD